jgi:hypothetical protein
MRDKRNVRKWRQANKPKRNYRLEGSPIQRGVHEAEYPGGDSKQIEGQNTLY